MKKTLITLLAALTLTACEKPETNSGAKAKTENPDYYYEIDGWGSDPDLYEFTPKSNPEYACIILVSGGDKSNGLSR